MKIVQFVSRVDPEKCNGDKRCEKLCPSGAIKVVDKIAVVQQDRCVACGKCSEVCREDAVEMVRRIQPLTIAFDMESVDPEKIQALCAQAGLLPDLPLCACTGTTVGEIAASIIDGAKSPEDVVVGDRGRLRVRDLLHGRDLQALCLCGRADTERSPLEQSAADLSRRFGGDRQEVS